MVARPIRIDNEQFSDNSVAIGEPIVITGELERNVAKPASFVLYVSAVPTLPYYEGKRDLSFLLQFQLLDISYSPIREQSTVYFEVRHNLSNPTTLEPGAIIPFEIKFYPQKSGTFHIHSLVITDDARYMGRGQTVSVMGGNTTTLSEILQIFFPLASGAAVLIVLTALMLRERRSSTSMVLGTKLYFMVKTSFETTWLLGILFWLASSPHFFALEAISSKILVTTMVLGAIVVGGYISTLSTLRRRRWLFPIVTLVATVAFYVVLGSSLLVHQFEQFRPHPIVWYAAVIANSAAAIFVAILVVKEKQRAQKLSQQ